jgi:hypothetical protein
LPVFETFETGRGWAPAAASGFKVSIGASLPVQHPLGDWRDRADTVIPKAAIEPPDATQNLL